MADIRYKGRGAVELIKHWINGVEVGSKSGRQGEVFNPALGTVTKSVDFADIETIDSAISNSKTAFTSWSQTSLTKRVQILFAFRHLLNAKKEELAAIITSEHGKVLSDALGEVTRGLVVVEFHKASMFIRFANHWASAQLSRHLIFQQWCRCGSSQSLLLLEIPL